MTIMSSMPPPSTNVFVRAFGALNSRIDILSTPLLREAFLESYFLYKKHVEDPFYRLLQRYPQLLGEGDIYDVGANLGYTSLLFAKHMGPQARVHAFEPEVRNFRVLNRATKKVQNLGKLTANQSAVGDQCGTISLEINPHHHADHKISSKQTGPANSSFVHSVPITSLDNYWATIGEKRPVSFVKIDVQGFEPQVLQGMTSLMAQFPNLRIALEYDEPSILGQGVSPADFIHKLQNFKDKCLYLITPTGELKPFNPDPKTWGRPYVDILIAESSLS